MWGLIDCDNFFCSCERVFRPDLLRRPVVVLSNNDGCVIARSAEAKAMGIKMGLPYYQLLQQYPSSGITAFSSNYTLYGDMSARVMSVLREEVPELLQYSIDEAFLNLEGLCEAELKVWGENLTSKIKRWTGMPVSLGIAPTKTLAKIATRFSKNYPGYHKCCHIHTEEQRLKALELFPVEEIWGIGRRLERRLKASGIMTARQFADLPQGYVRGEFHVTGERTWRELHGENAIEIIDMDSSRKSIMTSRSFPGMITDYIDLRTHVANYAARCAAKLRRQQSVCSMITVFVQSNFFRPDLTQYSNSASLLFDTPTFSTNEIVERSFSVLKAIFREGIHYKRAGVMVSDISSASAIQPNLFTFDPDRDLKCRKISEVIDEINNRLGADTVTLASQQYPAKEENGKNVKFTQAIKRDLKSPDYSTRIGAFKVK